MSVSRREFFRKSLAATGVGAGVVAATATKGTAAEQFAGYPDRYGVLVDLTLCTGCRTCEAACYAENHDKDSNRAVNNEYKGNLPKPEVPFDDVTVTHQRRRTSPGAYTVVNRYEGKGAVVQKEGIFKKLQCFHCNEPACASACLVGALRKTKEGAVVYDVDTCIGCRYCMTACPFYIPTYEYEKAFTPRVMKCTFCYHRLAEGRAPACVASCPFGVMTFGKRSELLEAAKERIARHPDRYVHHVYGEEEVGGTSWLYLSPVPFEEVGFQTNLPTVPLGEFTHTALSVVPMVVLLWPTLLGGLYALNRRRDDIAEQEKDTAVDAAVTDAVAQADAKAETKLAGALKKAEKDKEKAVKEAREEASKTTASEEESK
ncbi:MAG: 4Fe-4S dicluster domain-containing protein [Phycisphaerae bacterium]|nr:4Fe-4S dicluster domain-containing protein [Phycisphaerae bacterium]